MTPMTPPSILQANPLNETQLSAALTRDRDIVVTAGAGTGKTSTLVARYLALLDAGLSPRSIVAVTFTRKAAQEMRNRVRSEMMAYVAQPDISAETRQQWQTHINQLDAARIGTIHQLCSDILRTHPAEARLDPQFGVLDETDAALMKSRAIERTLAWLADSDSAVVLFNQFSERGLTALLGQLLNQAQQARAAFERTSDQPLDGWRTQLSALQQQQLEAWEQDKAWISAVATLRRSQPTNADDKMAIQQRLALTALTRDDSFSGTLRNLALLGEINLVGGSQRNWSGGKEQLAEVKAALKTLRDCYKDSILTCQLNAADEQVSAVLPPLRAAFDQLTSVYSRFKQERHALDFDDLEQRAIDLLAENSAVRRYWQATILSLLVDEFQDTNATQLRLIELLSERPGKLFVVGDAKQSIYRFRQADVAVFRRKQVAIGRDGGLQLALETCYRTHAKLGDPLNAIFPNVMGEPNDQTPDFEAPFEPLNFHQPAPPDGWQAPFIETHLALGSQSDGALSVSAEALAARLLDLKANDELSSWGDVAILCRASSAFKVYEDALDRAAIPYVTVAGSGFHDRPEVRTLLNALQALADPTNDVALAGLLLSPLVGLSDAGLYEITRTKPTEMRLWTWLAQAPAPSNPTDARTLTLGRGLVQRLHPLAGRMSVADLLKALLDETHFEAALISAENRRAVGNVGKLLVDAHQSGQTSVSGFLDYVQELRDSGSRQSEARGLADDALQIMTVHAAKGLEFSTVVLGHIGYDRGSKPSLLLDDELGVSLQLKLKEGGKELSPAMFEMAKRRETERDSAESKRLIYVAATRAKHRLMLSGTATLTKTGKLSTRGWLRQLQATIGLPKLDTSGWDVEGNRIHTQVVDADGGLVAHTIVEPNWSTTFAPQHPPISAEMPPLATPLLVDLRQPDAVVEEDSIRDRPVWQVVPTAKRTTVPARVLGLIVHEALEMWRFPDAGFAEWVASRVHAFGINDEARVASAVSLSRRMLNQLKAHRLFAEIDQAEVRYHELPFAYRTAEGLHREGIIDLLYRNASGWHIVDFKTDYLGKKPPDELRDTLVKYEKQVRGYASAVAQLDNLQPTLRLCFLNHSPDIWLHRVDSAEDALLRN